MELQVVQVEAWLYLPVLKRAPGVPAAVAPRVSLAQAIREHPQPLSTPELHV